MDTSVLKSQRHIHLFTFSCIYYSMIILWTMYQKLSPRNTRRVGRLSSLLSLLLNSTQFADATQLIKLLKVMKVTFWDYQASTSLFHFTKLPHTLWSEKIISPERLSFFVRKNSYIVSNIQLLGHGIKLLVRISTCVVSNYTPPSFWHVGGGKPAAFLQGTFFPAQVFLKSCRGNLTLYLITIIYFFWP